MTAELIVTRGLPASGKSTRARKLVDDDPTWNRVNRDDLRRMLHGRRRGTRIAEEIVTVAQHAAIRDLLTSGYKVIADDTNLNPEHLASLGALCLAVGARFTVWDMTDVPVDECVARDKLRTGHEHVGEKAIRMLHDQWLTPTKG